MHVGSPGVSPPPPAPPAPSPPPKTPITVRAAAARRAHKFQQTYFSTSAGVETDGTRLLKGVSGRLDQPGAAQELLDILSDRESANISTFEFLSSGCVEQLEAFLLGESFCKSPLSCVSCFGGKHPETIPMNLMPTVQACNSFQKAGWTDRQSQCRLLTLHHDHPCLFLQCCLGPIFLHKRCASAFINGYPSFKGGYVNVSLAQAGGRACIGAVESCTPRVCRVNVGPAVTA